jgi:hypothetical protein
MLTKSIRRKPRQVLAVLAAVSSLSGLAEAQQSGMFPLHPIRRERTPCANEEPIYKLYRNQYYGYFPTQWRRFPDGWSLRSPEGPNTVEELKKNPIEGPKPFAPEGEGEEMQGPAAPGARPPIPNPPPDERSPFEMDKPDSGAGAAPGTAAPGRRNPAPRGNTPPPATDVSPFDLPETKPPGAGATPGDRPQASRSSRPSTPTLPDQGPPDLAPPGDAPTPPPRTSWNRRNESRQQDPGPLLSMSDATLPSVEEATSPSDLASGAGAEPIVNNFGAADPASAPAAAQPQPAQRRGPISSFFAGLGLNWLRR